MAKKNDEKLVCPMTFVGSVVTGIGLGILTGNYLGFIVVGIGVGGIILGTTQRKGLLAAQNRWT